MLCVKFASDTLTSIPWVMVAWFVVSLTGLSLVVGAASSVSEFYGSYGADTSIVFLPFQLVYIVGLLLNSVLVATAFLFSGKLRHYLCNMCACLGCCINILGPTLQWTLFALSWFFTVASVLNILLALGLLIISLMGKTLCDSSATDLVDILNQKPYPDLNIAVDSEQVQEFCHGMSDTVDDFVMMLAGMAVAFVSQLSITVGAYAYVLRVDFATRIKGKLRGDDGQLVDPELMLNPLAPHDDGGTM